MLCCAVMSPSHMVPRTIAVPTVAPQPAPAFVFVSAPRPSLHCACVCLRASVHGVWGHCPPAPPGTPATTCCAPSSTRAHAACVASGWGACSRAPPDAPGTTPLFRRPWVHLGPRCTAWLGAAPWWQRLQLDVLASAGMACHTAPQRPKHVPSARERLELPLTYGGLP